MMYVEMNEKDRLAFRDIINGAFHHLIGKKFPTRYWNGNLCCDMWNDPFMKEIDRIAEEFNIKGSSRILDDGVQSPTYLSNDGADIQVTIHWTPEKIQIKKVDFRLGNNSIAMYPLVEFY